VNWEFYAVVDGTCGVLLESGQKLPVRSKHLWVFPPHHVHGWHGNRASCNVAVFHFGYVPPQLEEVIEGQEFLERNLEGGECEQISNLVRTMQPDYERPNALSDMRFHRGLLDLTLLALADQPARNISRSEWRAGEKVDAAIAWFRHNMHENPGVEEVASAVHVSKSHLRRIFLAAGRGSPHEVLNSMRLETAMRLMRETDLKLDSIATEVGFGSASDFSRAFKAKAGCSPREWRLANLPTFRVQP
jgi:AraC family transcriptional regulator